VVHEWSIVCWRDRWRRIVGNRCVDGFGQSWEAT
jgi:hypothetical protein